MKSAGRIGAWLLAVLGVALVLVALLPLGAGTPNVGFWVAAIGFDRLASVLPPSADVWMMTTGLVAMSTAAVIFLVSHLMRRGSSPGGGRRPRLGSVEQRLVNSRWIIVDPEKNLSKVLSFNADGTIGDGLNNDEHTWAVSGKYVDIFRGSGLLQNRFELHPSGERLNFIRDPRAMGPKGRFVRRAP